MGSAQSSKNIVENELKTAINMISENVLSNQLSGSAVNTVTFNNCHVKGVTINQKAAFRAEMSTVQTALSSQTLAQEINTIMEQMADNVAQSLSVSPNAQMTENISNLTQEMATEMININATDCIASVFAENTISCTNGSIEDSFFDQEAIANILTSCYQDSNTMQDLKQKLTNEISQTASNTVEDTLSNLVSSLTGTWIIIVLGGGFVLFKGGKKMVPGMNHPFIPLLLLGGGATYLWFECSEWNNWCGVKEES